MANELSFTIRVKNMVNQGIDAAKKSFAGLSTWAKNAGSSMTASMIKAAAGVFAFSKAVQMVGQAIKTSMNFEEMEDRFSTLIGSLDDAKKHMEDLRAVTKDSPFAFEDVAKASQELLKFSNGILGTAASMRTIADVAAGTDRSISEIGAAMGKAFSNLKAGLPIQRVALELRELGIITGEQVVQLKEMEKTGKPVADMWDLITKSMQRFNGEAEADSKRMTGIIAQIKNEWTFALKDMAEGFRTASGDASEFATVLGNMQKEGVFTKIGKGASTAWDFTKFMAKAPLTIGEKLGDVMGGASGRAKKEADAKWMFDYESRIADYRRSERKKSVEDQLKLEKDALSGPTQEDLENKKRIADEINDLYLRGQVEAAEAAAKRHKELAPEVSRVQALEILKARANAPRQSQMTAEAAKANLDAAQAQAQMSWQEWMDPALRAQRLEQEQKEQKFREEYQKMIPGILSRRKYFGSDQAFESTLKDREKAALQLSKDLEATEKARMNLETITKSVVVIASSLEKLLVTK